MTLYQIEAEYLKALESVELTEDGEIIGMDAVDKIKAELQDKAENIALYIKNQQSLADGITNEIKTLQERKKKVQNKIESLTDYLSFSLIGAGMLKVQTPKCELSFRKSEVVNIRPEAVLPEIYLKTKTEVTPDKVALKKALKEGEEIGGVSLDVKQNLQIK